MPRCAARDDPSDQAQVTPTGLEVETLRLLASLLLVLLLVLPAVADDKGPAPKPKPLTAEQAADAVLAAVNANDPAARQGLCRTIAPRR